MRQLSEEILKEILSRQNGVCEWQNDFSSLLAVGVTLSQIGIVLDTAKLLKVDPTIDDITLCEGGLSHDAIEKMFGTINRLKRLMGLNYSFEDYFEEVNAEKEALEATVDELAGYRERNEEMHHELKDLARENSHIEKKLADIVEEANALRLQMSELQSLKIQVAKFEAELELKTQQIIDYRTMLELFESSKTISKDTENLSEHDLNVEGCET